MIEAELPDGTIMEFPDGTSDEVIQKTVKSRVGSKPKPRSLEELSGGLLTRPAFEMAGGTGGAVLGAGAGGVAGVAGGPAAPATVPGGAIGGGLIGGGLGTAAGSLLFDSIEDVLRFSGVIESESPGVGERSIQALRSGAEDIAFAGGAQIVGKGLGAVKPGIGRILGLRSADVDAAVDAAAAAGIPVGAVDVGTHTGGRVVRGTARVLGIFPWIGGPFRKSAAEKADVVTTKFGEILDSMAPNATLSSDLGLDMAEAARGSIKEFRDVSSRLYGNFETLAKDAGSIVPTNVGVDDIPSIKEAAQTLVDRTAAGKIILEDGTELVGPAADEMGQFIEALTKLPDNLTIAQYRQLSTDLRGFIGLAGSNGLDVSRFATLKQSMEGALASIDPNVAGAEVVDALQTANSFYSKGITQFQTPTGQKFGRIDRNIFQPGPVRPGTINEDEIARVAVNLKSPQAIADLRALVGDDLMGQAARRHFETAWQGSIKSDPAGDLIGFNWKKFGDDVGLTGKGENAGALQEFIKGSGTDLDELKAFVGAASKVQVPQSVSTFIARRAALGGFSAALGGAVVAGLIPGSALGSVAAALSARHVTKIISDPAQLRAMRRALSPEVPVAQRRALLGRLIEAFDDEPDSEFRDKQIDRNLTDIRQNISLPTVPLPQGIQ